MTKRILRVGLCFTLGLLLLIGGLWFWYTHRPIPDSLQQTLFEGVTYVRDVRHQPRPLVIHVVTVELGVPGIGFLVTPGDSARDRPLRARKTSQFLSEFCCIVNADRPSRKLQAFGKVRAEERVMERSWNQLKTI